MTEIRDQHGVCTMPEVAWLKPALRAWAEGESSPAGVSIELKPSELDGHGRPSIVRGIRIHLTWHGPDVATRQRRPFVGAITVYRWEASRLMAERLDQYVTRLLISPAPAPLRPVRY